MPIVSYYITIIYTKLYYLYKVLLKSKGNSLNYIPLIASEQEKLVIELSRLDLKYI